MAPPGGGRLSGSADPAWGRPGVGVTYALHQCRTAAACLVIMRSTASGKRMSVGRQLPLKAVLFGQCGGSPTRLGQQAVGPDTGRASSRHPYV